MIEQAGRPVSRLELTKWAFLLVQEMPSEGGASFYDFLPYHYGPFSFMLFREGDRLVRDGYLEEVEIGGNNAWQRVPGTNAQCGCLQKDIGADAARVVERFADLNGPDLIDYVYERFPWYTINSRIRRLAQRHAGEILIHTIGYEGCSIDRLLDMLMREGIQRVIDVRRNPVARRYGFHKSSLDRLCSKIDIDYFHIPEVGIASGLRRNLDGPEAYARLLREYETNLLPQEGEALARIADMMLEKPAALMCMEANPAMCHRSRLAKAVSRATGLPVHHIGGRDATRI